MKNFIKDIKDLITSKRKDWYCHGMANALYIFAKINNIDVTWDICYQIAYESTWMLPEWSIQVDGYLHLVEKSCRDIFTRLQSEENLIDYESKAEIRRIRNDDRLSFSDMEKLINRSKERAERKKLEWRKCVEDAEKFWNNRHEK